MNVLKPKIVDFLRKELNNKYYFYMKEVVEEEEAVEERRGRGYKEGDRMVEEGDFFWRVVRRNFLQKNRGKKVMEKRGKKIGGGG